MQEAFSLSESLFQEVGRYLPVNARMRGTMDKIRKSNPDDFENDLKYLAADARRPIERTKRGRKRSRPIRLLRSKVSELKDATGQWCVVMATVPGHPNPNPIATVVPFNPALPCLQFIYRLNPYSDTDAVPHTGWIGANPLPFNAAFVQGANLEPREIQDLTIGYLGTANHQTGAFESCLFWNAASGNSIVFEMTTVESACTQLRAMYFFKF